MHDSNKKSSKKKINIYLKPQVNIPTKLSNIFDEKEYKEHNDNNKLENSSLENSQNFQNNQNTQNKILHEAHLKEIEILQKKLNEMERQNELILKEKSILKNKQNDLQEKYDKINKEFEKENAELNELKEANKAKNIEYARLQDLNNQHNNRNNNNSNDTEENQDNNNTSRNNENNENNENNDNDNENDGFNDRFNDIFNGLNFLLNISRLRRAYEEENDESRLNSISNNLDESNNDEGPAMTNEQLQALDSSIYPRNNNSDEKCTICGFDLCYNDTVSKLKCNHIFHKDCLISRLTARHSSKCPTCKISLI